MPGGGSTPAKALQIRFRTDDPWTDISDYVPPATTATWSLWSHRWQPAAPGRYHISVDSYVQDLHNDADLVLAPSGEAYAKVLPLDSFVQGGAAVGGGYKRNTFVVWLYPPEQGRAAVAHSYFTAGGS